MLRCRSVPSCGFEWMMYRTYFALFLFYFFPPAEALGELRDAPHALGRYIILIPRCQRCSACERRRFAGQQRMGQPGGTTANGGPEASVAGTGPEKHRAHLDRGTAGDGGFASPLDCLVQISSFQNPKTAYVFLGLYVWPVSGEHRTIGLLSQRSGVFGRGKAAGKLPGAGSNHFAVERVDSFYSRFGFDRRVVVVRTVNCNQILWHEFSFMFGKLFALLSDRRLGGRESTAALFFIATDPIAVRLQHCSRGGIIGE